jgi:hypothetical protein
MKEFRYAGFAVPTLIVLQLNYLTNILSRISANRVESASLPHPCVVQPTIPVLVVPLAGPGACPLPHLRGASADLAFYEQIIPIANVVRRLIFSKPLRVRGTVLLGFLKNRLSVSQIALFFAFLSTRLAIWVEPASAAPILREKLASLWELICAAGARYLNHAKNILAKTRNQSTYFFYPDFGHEPWKKVILGTMCLLLLCSPVYAQHSFIKPDLAKHEAIKPSEPGLNKQLAPVDLKALEKNLPPKIDKTFLGLSAIYATGVVADFWTTKSAIDRGGREGNPLFARNGGRSVSYGLNAAVSGGIWVTAYLLQRSGAKKFARGLLVFGSAWRFGAAIHNHGVRR